MADETPQQTADRWGRDAAVQHAARVDAEQYYVHYTVDGCMLGPDKPPQHCVAGPYGARAVLDHFRDIRGYAGISNAYVSQTRERGDAGTNQ